jgi:hypothetical protein
MSSGSEERTMDTGNEPTDVQTTSTDRPQTEAATPTDETGAQETRVESTAAEGAGAESTAARPTGEPTDTGRTETEPTDTGRTETERTETERTETERIATDPAGQPDAAPTAWGYPPQESAAEPPRGPAIAPILLGVLVLATAAFALADQALDLSVDWGQVGPVGILLGGGVLVLLGLLGMRRRPR